MMRAWWVDSERNLPDALSTCLGPSLGLTLCSKCPPFGQVRPLEHLHPGLVLVGHPAPTKSAQGGMDPVPSKIPFVDAYMLPACCRILVSIQGGLWIPREEWERAPPQVLGVGSLPGLPQTSERVITSTELCYMPRIGRICMLLNTKEGSNDPFRAAPFHRTASMAALVQGISWGWMTASSFSGPSTPLLWSLICKSTYGCPQPWADSSSNCACVIDEMHSLFYSL